MSSEKHNGVHGEGNAACSQDSFTEFEKNPQNLDPDELYEAYLSQRHKEEHEHDNALDDFDLRFMEEVCKERRENSDGWDKYLEILRDGLIDDHDEIVANLDQHQHKITTNSSNFNGADSSSNAKASKSFSPYVTQTSRQQKHDKSKSKEEQNVHYFRNGTCYYGNPMKDAKRSEKQRKSESTLEDSEIEFYKNLRAYFGTAKEKTDKRTSQSSEKKTSKLSTTLSEKESKHFATDGARKKYTFPNTAHTEQNEISSKGAKEAKLGQTLHSGLGSSKFESISTSTKFSRKEPTKQGEEDKDISTKNKNTIETNKGKKIEEAKLKHGEVRSKFENGLKEKVHLSDESFGSREQADAQFQTRVASENGSTPSELEKESCRKSLGKQHTTASKKDNSVSSKMNEVHGANSSKQNYPMGISSESEPSASSVSEQETFNKPLSEHNHSTSKSDTSASSKKNDGCSMSSPSAFKGSREASCSNIGNSNTTKQKKTPKSGSNEQVNGSFPTQCASEESTKSNFSHVTKEKQKCSHKGKEKCTQTGEEFSFVNDGEKTHSQRKFSFEKEESKPQREKTHPQRKPSFEKEESKPQREKTHSQRKSSFEKEESKPQTVNDKAYRKAKKSHKTPEDHPQHSHKSSSASKLQRDGKLPRHKVPDSKDSENPFQKVRFVRQSKEEMITRISANEALESLLRRFLYGVKEIGIKCLKVLLWILYYAIIIIAVIVLCSFTVLKGIVLFLYGYVMSLGVTIAIIDKLWLVKVHLTRWYGDVKEFIREKIYGPKRAAQTYNLPNSGEDAVQQLILRQGPDDNPYRILGVPKEASDEDIRKQYRKFAVLVHPDKNKHPHSAEAFQILSSAYDVLGDADKRQQYDRELARREQMDKDRASGSGNFMKNPADYKDPHDFFADLMKQMEEIRESLSCNACGGRHRRKPTDRSVYQARFCYDCRVMHQAKEGDFWKESTFLGIGPGKFYTRMENVIYDITAWGICQERCGFHLPSDSHKVCGKINSHRQQPPPRQRYTEEQLFRDIFGHHEDFSHGHHDNGHQSRTNHHNKTKQQKRRRKKK